MPHLMQLLTSPSAGGAEGYALTIAASAVERGWPVSVGLSGSCELDRLREDYRRIGAQPHGIDLIGGLKSGRAANTRRVATHVYRTRRLLRRTRPDVVHLNLPFPDRGTGAMVGAASAGTPALIVHQLVPGPFALSATWRSAQAAARRRRQQLVAVSEHNRRWLAQALDVPTATVLKISNGVAPAEPMDARSLAAAKASFRAELGLDSETVIILGIGRLEDQKGFDLLVPALGSVLADDPSVMVLIAGDGAQRQHLESQVTRDGFGSRVRFLGKRDDIPRLLRAADCFVFPSRVEGLPFALMEAMAHEVPIVASNIPVVCEVTQDEACATLFVSGDASSFERAVREVLVNPRETDRRVLAASRRIEDFSQEAMIDQTLLALEDLASHAYPPHR